MSALRGKVPLEDVWHIYWREKKSVREAAYIHGLLTYYSLKYGETYRKILDAACGPGRLHPYLVKLGYSVDGYDIEEEFVEKAQERNPQGKYWVGDMRKERGNGEYDVVISWYTSFGYFDPETNRKVLENFTSFLRPGGLLILDLHTPYEEFRVWWAERPWGYELAESEVVEKDGRRFWIVRTKFLPMEEEDEVWVELFYPEEIEELLENLGYGEVEIFGDYGFQGFKKHHGRMVVVGRYGKGEE